MVQALNKTQLVTFTEFAQWKPKGKFYELHEGVIIDRTNDRRRYSNY